MSQIIAITANIVLHEQYNSYLNIQQLFISISELFKEGQNETENDRKFDLALYGSVGGFGIIGTSVEIK